MKNKEELMTEGAVMYADEAAVHKLGMGESGKEGGGLGLGGGGEGGEGLGRLRRVRKRFTV